MQRSRLNLGCTLLVVVSTFAFDAGCSSNSANPAINPSATSGTPSSTASIWENKLVSRPGTKPEDTKIYVVQNGRKHWVVNGAWLAAHGFKFPDDVHIISPAELDAIATGDTIQ
jgi:hypothetical protein